MGADVSHTKLSHFDVLKCLATIFITLSHLDAFVPDPRIASGGAIGNSLFFLISGYGVQLSFDKSRKDGLGGFCAYFFRRLLRIYPSTWIVAFLGLIFSIEVVSDISDVLRVFVWPTPFWFVSAISVFYFLFYFVVRQSLFIRKLIVFSIFLPYFYWYFELDLSVFSVEGPGYFKWIVYFQLMVFGSVLAGLKVPSGAFLPNFLFLFLFLFLFFVSKVLINKLNLWHFQFVFQFLAFPIVFYFFVFAKLDTIHALIYRLRIEKVVFFLSMLTLEIYLVQTYWIHWVESVDLDFAFPIPLIVAVLPLLPFSYFVFYIKNFFVEKLSFKND